MDRKKQKLVVLMAAYNGEKYINEQIDSISKSCDFQKISYEIIISDDFSTDSTLKILQNNKAPITILRPPTKKGSAKGNFSYLLDYTKENHNYADYYMLSDQDDIWCIDKVKVSLKKIKEIEKKYKKNKPSLVFSDAKVVDENLNIIHESYWDYESINPKIAFDLKKLSIQNVVQGATILFNKELLIKSTPIPKNITMHDRWLTMVAVTCGTIDLIPNKTILYRQHQSNQVGSRGLSLLAILKRLNYHLKNGKKSLLDSKKQAKEFMFLYKDEISDENLIFLINLYNISNTNFFYRKIFIINNNLFLGSFIRNIGLFILI